MSFELNIPKHWEWISLTEDFIYVPTGVQYFGDLKEYYSTGGISSDSQIPEGEYTFNTKPSRANRSVKTGDVLQARMKNTNKALIINNDLNDSLFSTGFFQLRPYPDTYNTKFLFYYLSSDYFAKIKDELCSGSTQSALNDTNAKKIKVPLPPLKEQKLIVEKLDEIFSEIYNGIENLTVAKEQLKIYRQSLLNDAFNGKLTEDWRKKNSDKIITPDDIIKNLKEEHDKIYANQIKEWEKAVNVWEKAGKIEKKPLKPKKQKQPSEIISQDLKLFPLIPSQWTWIKLGNIAYSIKDGPHYSPKYVNDGIPFISGGNIRPYGVDFKNVKYISKELHEELSQRCKPEYGDILYTKGGTTGIARVNTYKIDFNVWVHVAVLKLVSNIESFYVQHMLNSPLAYHQSQKYTHGVGNQDLGLTRMTNIIIPLCSKEEQIEIIKQIESSFVKIDLMEKIIDKTLIDSINLIQSLYLKAFSGELVDYDNNDLSVKDLINKIKIEKKKYLDNQKIKKKLKPKKKVEKLEMKILEILETNLLGLSPEELFSKSIYSKENEIDKFYDELNKLLKDKKILENRIGKEKEKILIKLNKKS
jgi:type I restriction enzyme, S subunit